MTSRPDVLVSAIAVLRSSARFLPQFVDELCATLAEHYANYEVILIDNGSRDETARVARQLLARYPCVRYLRLSRRMKAETATVAGLDAAIGDYVVALHPEFDPPAEIPAMVEKCRAGADLVHGAAPFAVPPGVLYRLLRWGFACGTRWALKMEPVRGGTGFRVLSRAAVNALTRVRQRRRFFDLLASDIGLTAATHPYRFISRTGKVPRANLRRSIRTGASMALNHSLAPLRLVSAFGLLGSLVSLAYSLYVVGVYFLKPDVMPGWTTLSLQMSGLFFLVFVMLTMIGEHLGRLLDESLDRPLYHVREEQSSSVMLSNLVRRNVMDRSE